MRDVREGIAMSECSDRWPSGRSVLAGTAFADLSWWLGLKELVAAVPDWAVAGLTLTVSQLPFELVDQGLTWLLFAVSFYVVTPTVFPDRLGFSTDSRLFRALVVVYSFGFAFGLAVGDPLGRVAFLLGLWVLGAVTVLVYLRAVEGWTLLGDPAVLLQPLDAFRFGEQLQSEYATNLEDPVGLDWVSIGATLLAVGGMVIVPCVLLGAIARLLLLAGPLPDVLVLAWVLWGAVASRVSMVPRPERSQGFDLEARLHQGVQMATKNAKGFFLTIWVVLGVILPAGTGGLFFVALSAVIENPTAITTLRVLRQAPVLVSTLVGVPAVLLASCLYGLWVWLRAFPRVDAFADYWRAPDEWRGDAGRELPLRPVGTTIPAAVGLLGVGVGIHGPRWLFAVSWPLYVLGIAGCVWLTRRRSGAKQSIEREDHVILGSLLVYLLGMYLLAVGEQLLSASGIGAVVALLGNSIFVPLAILATALTYWPNVTRYAREQTGVRSYVTGAYLVAIGSLALVLSLNRTDSQWPIVRVFGLTAIGFGILSELLDILHDAE